MTKEQGATPRKHSKMRTVLIGTVKAVLLATLLFFVGRALVAQLRKTPWEQIHFNVPDLCLGVLCIIAGRISVGLAYRFLLRHLGSRLTFSAAMTVVWLPQLGKYVPGKVTALLGAVWMMGRYGVPTARAAKTVCVVVLLSILLGMMIAVPLTLWEPVSRMLPLGWLWCIVFIVGGMVALHPKVLNLILHLPMKRMGITTDAEPVRMRDYGPPAAFLALNWLLTGMGMWFVTRSMAGAEVRWIPILVSAVALAITTGFLAFFSPSGLGVREGVLLIVLTPLVGNAAAAVTILMRLTHMFVDVTLAGVSLVIMRFAGRKSEVKSDKL